MAGLEKALGGISKAIKPLIPKLVGFKSKAVPFSNEKEPAVSLLHEFVPISGAQRVKTIGELRLVLEKVGGIELLSGQNEKARCWVKHTIPVDELLAHPAITEEQRNALEAYARICRVKCEKGAKESAEHAINSLNWNNLLRHHA